MRRSKRRQVRGQGMNEPELLIKKVNNRLVICKIAAGFIITLVIATNIKDIYVACVDFEANAPEIIYSIYVTVGIIGIALYLIKGIRGLKGYLKAVRVQVMNEPELFIKKVKNRLVIYKIGVGYFIILLIATIIQNIFLNYVDFGVYAPEMIYSIYVTVVCITIVLYLLKRIRELKEYIKQKRG